VSNNIHIRRNRKAGVCLQKQEVFLQFFEFDDQVGGWDLQFVQQVANIGCYFIAPEEFMRICSKFSHLKTLKIVLNPAPCIITLDLCDTFYQERKNAQLHMGFDTAGCPMVHGTHLDLSPFHRAETALDNH